MIKKVNINICPILDSYGDMNIFNSRTRPHVNRVLRNQLAGDVPSFVAYRLRKLQRATRAVHNSVTVLSYMITLDYFRIPGNVPENG